MRGICVRCEHEHVVYRADVPDGDRRVLCASCLRRYIDEKFPDPRKRRPQ